MGYVTLATERLVGTEDRKVGNYLEQALLSSRRARDLIQQMLTFSRGQRGERRPVDLRRVAAESARLLRSSMPSTLELETVSAADVPLTSLDRVQGEQVLLNLCINARDALGGNGKVLVRVGRAADHAKVCTSCRARFDGDFVELAVADDGPGIPPEVMERMFEPFFSTKEVGKGSGMGLATVHGIVHEHGGHIVVESAPGRGATFRVLLPVLRVDDDVTEHETLPGYVPASRKPGLRGHVLLVDDEEMVVGFMRELLKSWGLEVTATRAGPDAREIFADDPDRYDLVITDQTMPRMTGLELARELLAIRPGLPVVLYTGYADGVMDAQVQAAGVRALLKKPVEPAQLLALLRAHLPAAGRAGRGALGGGRVLGRAGAVRPRIGVGRRARAGGSCRRSLAAPGFQIRMPVDGDGLVGAQIPERHGDRDRVDEPGARGDQQDPGNGQVEDASEGDPVGHLYDRLRGGVL